MTPTETHDLREAAARARMRADIAVQMGRAAKRLSTRLDYARSAARFADDARNLESIAAKYSEREDAA